MVAFDVILECKGVDKCEPQSAEAHIQITRGLPKLDVSCAECACSQLVTRVLPAP